MAVTAVPPAGGAAATPTATAETSPPAAPAQVLFGDTEGASLGPPKQRPAA